MSHYMTPSAIKTRVSLAVCGVAVITHTCMSYEITRKVQWCDVFRAPRTIQVTTIVTTSRDGRTRRKLI